MKTYNLGAENKRRISRPPNVIRRTVTLIRVEVRF